MRLDPATKTRTAARVVREALLSLRGEPVIGDALELIGNRASDAQLLSIARRVK